MANYDFTNFKFSADILEMSARDFKELVKRRYGYSVKKATALYKHIHGYDISVSEEAGEGSE